MKLNEQDVLKSKLRDVSVLMREVSDMAKGKALITMAVLELYYTGLHITTIADILEITRERVRQTVGHARSDTS